MAKNTPFFPILHVFAPLNDVRAYIAFPGKTTLLHDFFYEDDIQLQIQVPPPRYSLPLEENKFSMYKSILSSPQNKNLKGSQSFQGH